MGVLNLADVNGGAFCAYGGPHSPFGMINTMQVRHGG